MNPISSPAHTFRAIDVIRKKRDGGELSPDEIERLINAYTRDEIPDYQVSAWLMAVAAARHDPRRNGSAYRCDVASGEVLDLIFSSRKESR